MKHLVLTAVCTATVEEVWHFEVPDDFDTAGTPSEVYDQATLEVTEGVQFKGCENASVYDERDREFTKITEE